MTAWDLQAPQLGKKATLLPGLREKVGKKAKQNRRAKRAKGDLGKGKSTDRLALLVDVFLARSPRFFAFFPPLRSLFRGNRG